MKRAAPSLIVLAALVLAVSGCTIPGTDIEIPGIPDLFGGQTVNYENDIIVIKNIQVIPATKVKSNQVITLYADIQNQMDPDKAAGAVVENVKVDLYDHCTSLLEVVEQSCGGDGDMVFDMKPQEVKTCRWKLKPRSVRLITPCELKVKVTYHHKTDTVTSLTFIDKDELESRIRRGEAWKVSGSTSRGYGPVKVFLEVETQQPVPIGSEDDSAPISVIVKNVGAGYIKDSKLKADDIDLTGLEANGKLEPVGCDFSNRADKNYVDIIRKQTTPLFCAIKAPEGVEVEQTFDLQASVAYDYEFRKSINVQIEPATNT